jgi:hypothetical protein
MTVFFRDELGYIGVKVDEYNIQFCDGKAYFSDGEKDYKIPMEDLIEIKSGEL